MTLTTVHWQLKDKIMNMQKIMERKMTLDPKDAMMRLEDQAYEAFYDEHDREPTAAEEKAISQAAYEGIGDYYADIGDRARDMAKGN